MKQKNVLGPDGKVYSPEANEKLNTAFLACFRDRSGDVVLDYLRSITLNTVSGPNLDSNALIHQEGQRYLFQIIQQRVQQGEQSARKAQPRKG